MPFHIEDYQIRWKNYRGFEDTGWLTIRPITVLIGPNNSGKTSGFSPLLLLNQTMTSRYALTPLLTRGPLIDCGNFSDIIYQHDTSRPLFMGLRFHVHKPSGKLEPVTNYLPGAIEITLTPGKRAEDIDLFKFDIFDVFCRPYISFTQNGDGTYAVNCEPLGKLTDTERRAISITKPVNFIFDPSDTLQSYREISVDDEDTSLHSIQMYFLST